MEIGLLWYDPEGSLQERVARASRRHLQKHGLWPDTCQVHPSSLGNRDEYQFAIGKDREVRVLPSPYVSRDYYWVGVDASG